MAQLREIKRKIQSFKSTRQMTRAMKMVAASKLKKRQEMLGASRAFHQGMDEILTFLVDPVTRHHKKEFFLEPSLSEKKEKLIIIAGERGLCGGFNNQVFKTAVEYMKQHKEKKFEITTIGKKAFDFFKKSPYFQSNIPNPLIDKNSRSIIMLVENVLEHWKEISSLRLIYNKFVSVLVQKPTIELLLPLPSSAPMAEKNNEKEKIVMKFAPHRSQFFDLFLPKYLESTINLSLHESLTSEFGARMAAMENATRSATEMIDLLTIEFNKARQAGITKELIEISSGVEAMG